jgi:hypothetical protein
MAAAADKDFAAYWTLSPLDEAPFAFRATNPVFTRDFREGGTKEPVVHACLKYVTAEVTIHVTIAYATQSKLRVLELGFEDVDFEDCTWSQNIGDPTVTLMPGGIDNGTILSLKGARSLQRLILRLRTGWERIPHLPADEDDDGWKTINDGFVLPELADDILSTSTAGNVMAELRHKQVSVVVDAHTFVLADDIFQAQDLTEYVKKWCAAADDPHEGLTAVGSWSRGRAEICAPKTLEASADKSKLLIHDGLCGGTLRMHVDCGMMRDSLKGLFDL